MISPLTGKECAGVVEAPPFRHRQWLKSFRTAEILVQLARGGHADRGTADMGLAQGIAEGRIVTVDRHLGMAERVR
jgi:hypothetical protein